MPTKIRAFLAMTVPTKVQKKVGALVQDLKKKAPEINWLSPDKLHVTLFFFGDVNEQELMTKMVPAISPILKSVSHLDLACGGIGVFPDWKYPKVIWAGITGDTERLMLLHDGLVDHLKSFDLKRDKRLFRPHLTIGRADKIRKDAHVVRLVEHLGPIEFGHIPVKELTLFRSELTNDGPIYTPLKVLPLG